MRCGTAPGNGAWQAWSSAVKFRLGRPDRRGVMAFEYAIIASVISAIVIAAVTNLGGSYTHTFNDIGISLTSAMAGM